MEIIQIAILLFSTFALSRVFINIKNKTIGRLEAIFWLIFWTAVILASIIPNTIELVANTFGVERGVDLAMYAGMILLSYMIFRLYAKLENTEKKITKIIRTIAIKK